VQIAFTGAENQRESSRSQSVSVVSGRCLNQRVAGSSPARFTSSITLRALAVGTSIKLLLLASTAHIVYLRGLAIASVT
jgi:hypothetical protein